MHYLELLLPLEAEKLPLVAAAISKSFQPVLGNQAGK
jgi:hypothetical protein